MRHDAPDRAAARHRGGLARGLRDARAPARPGRGRRRAHAPFDDRAHHDRAVRPARQASPRARHRPARVLVLPPARVAEEGRADGRRVPAQQPVHVPVDGEARGLLRDDPARAQGPETVLVPYKNPPDNARFAYTAAKYNQPFDLGAIAADIGYPLFMKPYDGGQWVGVNRVRDEAELQAAYDASGERLMHLQASVEGFDVFARSLSIGPETMVMHFRPDRPMHDRYAVDPRLPEPGDRRRGADDRPPRQRVLPLGVQLLRDARARRRGLTRSTTPTRAPTSR